MASQPWDFSVPDWEQRLREGRSLVPDLPLNEALARKAVSLFDKLRLPDVPGQPTLEEAAGDWQRDIVRAIFGSLVDGERKVPEVFLLVPKKNSKTTGGAGMALTGLLMNERPRAEFIYVGPTQEVADLAFQQTKGMIEADDEEYLSKRFHVQEHIKTITDRRTKAKLKIKTFDGKVVTGSKPVFVLLDELHLMGAMNNATNVIGQIRGGLLANPEAVLIIITTQSDKPPAGPFKAELNYARRTRDGEIPNSRMLPVLYEFPRSMQADPEKSWRDPENWSMVTPNAGRSITIPRLVADYDAAMEKGAEEEQRWASQHLNIEIGIALHADRWAGADYWAAASEVRSLEELLERCEVAVAGVDGGGLDDLLGLGVIGREKGTRNWLSWSRAWAHTRVLDLRKDIAERLRDFRKDGDLIVCEDPEEPARQVAALIRQVKDAGLLPEQHGVGLDPWCVADLVEELALVEIVDEALVAVRQGSALSPATWGLETKLYKKTFRPAKSAMMEWCVGNAKAEQRGNAQLITKQAAGKAKIDPLVAVFNAAMLMSRNPTAPRKRKPRIQIL